MYGVGDDKDGSGRSVDLDSDLDLESHVASVRSRIQRRASFGRREIVQVLHACVIVLVGKEEDSCVSGT